jgi:hypothetical protein
VSSLLLSLLFSSPRPNTEALFLQVTRLSSIAQQMFFCLNLLLTEKLSPLPCPPAYAAVAATAPVLNAASAKIAAIPIVVVWFTFSMIRSSIYLA